MNARRCRDCGGDVEYCGPGMTTNMDYYRCTNCGYIVSRRVRKAGGEKKKKK